MNKKGFLALILAVLFLAGIAEARKTELTPADQRDWQVIAPQDSDSPLRDYAMLYEAGGHDGNIGVIGIPSMKVYRYIKMGVDMHNFPFSGSNAGNNNGTPDGKFLWVSDKGADAVIELNLQTGFAERILANPKPFGIHHSAAMSPNGKYIFLTGELSGKVAKMRVSDGATTVIDVPPAPSAPDYPDTSKDGKYLFAGNYYHSATMVFSQDHFKFIKVIPVGAGPLHNQPDTFGKYNYISSFVSDSTSKVDLGRMQMVDEFPIHYRVGHNSIAPDNHYYVSQNKYSTGLFNPTGIVYAVNFEEPDIDELTPTYGKSVKIVPINGEPHEGRQIFSTTIQRWNTGTGGDLFAKGYELGDVKVSFDDKNTPGRSLTKRPSLEPLHLAGAKRYFIPRDDGKPGVTQEGDVTVVRIKAFSYGYIPRFIHVKKGAKVRIILTNIDKAAGLTKNPDVTMGFLPAGYYGQKTRIDGVRGMSGVGEFIADKAGEFEFYCQQFCGPLHLEMRGTFFVDPPGGTASLSVGDYDEMSKLEYQLTDPSEREFITGGNRLLNTLKEGNEPAL